ncbi:hypothetical protein C10C_0261 [Chlamydia serpentis]|uniref:Inclusion membrane protein B n=1 Tax=Chlamydia serpentis TaxID=1967782 RepID=A0A2R8FAJ3_9CHLA|nr:inclusion membrane protein IncB [Chlamydia serpentis]SPN73435.1 hypothetical protein C10C_0261 [Chlamydia serpentis]
MSTPNIYQLSEQVALINNDVGILRTMLQEQETLNESTKQALDLSNTLAAHLLARGGGGLNPEELDKIKLAAGIVLSKADAEKKSGTSFPISAKSPCIFKKILATVLTVIAIIAIAILIACIIAVCGGFPALITLLNLYTIGACMALPIIGSVATATICLSLFGARSLLQPTLITCGKQ